MSTLFRLDNTVTVASGSANPASIPTTGVVNDDCSYFLNIYSPSSLVYLVPAGSTDTVSGCPIMSGSDRQYGPVFISGSLGGVPDIYFTATSGSVYVTWNQVVSEG